VQAIPSIMEKAREKSPVWPGAEIPKIDYCLNSARHSQLK
jgi:hypothetical protein